MINNKQQTPMTGKGKLSLLIAGAVLSMAVSAPTLAATTGKTPSAATPAPAISAPTSAVIGHAPKLLDDGKVTANDADKDGVLGIGDTLTVSGFTFDDEDGDASKPTTYEWFADGAPISGEVSSTLILKKDWLGKKITVKATAHTDPAITEPAQSTTAIAAKTYIGIDNKPVTGDTGIPTVSGSVVKSVTISGDAEVGKKLTAAATCHGTCDNNKLTYQWQIESQANSGLYTDIPSATTKEYTVKNTDQKKKIKVIASSK